MTTTHEHGGRDELNFAGFPNGVLSLREAKSPRVDFPAVSISAGDDHGLPGILDEEVLVGLITMTHQVNGFADPLVSFKASAMRRLLGWRDGGYSDGRLDASLRRWVGCTFTFHNSWFDRVSGVTGQTTFNVLTRVTDGKGSRGARAYEVVWNDTMFASLRAGHIRPFDFDVYRKLTSALAKRLFRILGKHSHLGSLTQRFELRTLAFDLVGMAGRGSLDAGQIKQKLNAAFDQLEEVGFLVKIPLISRYNKRSDGSWEVVAVVDAGLGLPATPPAPSPPDSPEMVEILRIYKNVGVSDPALDELRSTYTAEYLREKWEIFNANPANKKIKNVAGWLMRACKENWKGPVIDVDSQKKATMLSTPPASSKTTEINNDSPYHGFTEEQWHAICLRLEALHPEEVAEAIASVPAKLRNMEGIVKAYKMNGLWELYKTHGLDEKEGL